jgi:hypothetical protein
MMPEVCPAELNPCPKCPMLVAGDDDPLAIGPMSPSSSKHAEAGEIQMNGNGKKGRARYDSELQMFCDATHEPSREALQFLRWMAEQGRLEHAVFGPSAGEYAGEDVGELVSQAA